MALSVRIVHVVLPTRLLQSFLKALHLSRPLFVCLAAHQYPSCVSISHSPCFPLCVLYFHSGSLRGCAELGVALGHISPTFSLPVSSYRFQKFWIWTFVLQKCEPPPRLCLFPFSSCWPCLSSSVCLFLFQMLWFCRFSVCVVCHFSRFSWWRRGCVIRVCLSVSMWNLLDFLWDHGFYVFWIYNDLISILCTINVLGALFCTHNICYMSVMPFIVFPFNYFPL